MSKRFSKKQIVGVFTEKPDITIGGPGGILDYTEYII